MKYELTAPTWAEINLDNIKYNLNNIKSLISKDTMVCAVVKANAYGHGAVEISKLLQTERVDYLAVARLEEALELRQNDINTPILCLGYIPIQSLEVAINNDITLTIYSLETAKIISDLSKRLGKSTKVHVKIDTGMSRLGFLPNKETIEDILVINDLQNIVLEGIYTHFAKADEMDKAFSKVQVDKFNSLIEQLSLNKLNIPIKHTANSAAIIDFDNKLDMVRAGIILYGHYPSDEVFKDKIDLKPAMKLKTTISNLKEIDIDTGVSYGQKYISNKKETIATISIGYADGFSRIQKDPNVLIKGILFDVIGRVCMDQCMVKIDKDIDISIGDEVIVFGEGDATVENIANKLETINYEVLCMVSRRVKRIYMEKSAILQVSDYLVK